MKQLTAALMIVFAFACTTDKSKAADAAVVVASNDTGVPPDTLVSPAEREAYVEKNLELTGVDVSPDIKPADDGGTAEVGGLLRCAGLVTNKGDQGVKNATIALTIMDSSGKVIGTYFHDVVGNKRLAPGEQRNFKFEIPSKKEYGGKFTFTLR